jgi:hypothetical protein
MLHNYWFHFSLRLVPCEHLQWETAVKEPLNILLTYIYTYVRAYLRTYIDIHTYTYIHTYIHNTYIHTYIHTYTHTHTYVHTYVQEYIYIACFVPVRNSVYKCAFFCFQLATLWTWRLALLVVSVLLLLQTMSAAQSEYSRQTHSTPDSLSAGKGIVASRPTLLFITLFTTARHLSLPWSRLGQYRHCHCIKTVFNYSPIYT